MAIRKVVKKQAAEKKAVQIGIEDMPRKDQPYFNLYQTWVLKGCLCAWNTFRITRYIQPKGGLFDGYVGGVGVFTNETVKEWLLLLDEDMERYNRKYRTGAKYDRKIKKGKRLKAYA